MSQEIINRITGLVQAFDSRVQAAPATAWGNASPCEGWTARDVVVHVGDNLLKLSCGLAGQPPRSIGADADIVAAWNDARDTFLGTIPTADLSTSLPGPMGPMPAADMIGRFISTDVLVHTWDLARAVGGDETLDAATVAAAYSGLKPMDAMIRMPGVFGPRIDVSDTDLQTEFLSFLGRTV
ncbi:MAG: maleylpyruvate isomerase family mycothiol-dependent enzyme [Actinomycetota bacterium]|nr:maleylpyruvate isomerase family mycothiol-dependent enzyme [Actinomycetota bacterium]